jgi:hypothetical protein
MPARFGGPSTRSEHLPEGLEEAPRRLGKELQDQRAIRYANFLLKIEHFGRERTKTDARYEKAEKLYAELDAESSHLDWLEKDTSYKEAILGLKFDYAKMQIERKKY